MFILGKVRDLSELTIYDSLEQVDRSSVEILCIDDQGLEYENIIRQHGFNIRTLRDIVDIKAVREYPVIICDIKGVGKSFGSQYEGGHIIEEIKAKYPEKVIVAYTGQQFDARYNKFFSMADFILTKDIDSDTWISMLDQTITRVISPTEQWKRMRISLIDRDVPIKTIFQLEQEFIEAVKTGNKSKFAKESTMKGVSSDVRSIITSFIASALFKLIFGT